jgi:hypothetical protein
MSVIKKSSVCVAVFLGMFVSVARAQEKIVVRVPFPFMVHGEQLPAGRYDVTIDGGVLAIRGAEHNHSGVFATTFGAGGGDPAGDKPALVFIRHENEYLLSQVWESSDEGRALAGLSASAVEHHAEAQSDGTTVVIAAR